MNPDLEWPDVEEQQRKMKHNWLVGVTIQSLIIFLLHISIISEIQAEIEYMNNMIFFKLSLMYVQ